MIYDNSIVDAFLHDIPISNQALYPYIKGYQKPDKKRKDIVEELTKQTQQIVETFPVFNPSIWNAVFANMDEYIDSIHICSVVGSSTLCYSAKINDDLYIFIDLLCVANHTRIVSQMVYIVNNLISLEVSKHCILKQFPLTSNNYNAILDEAAFVHGFAHYISWNTSCENYVFHTQTYEERRIQAFGLLSQALQVDTIQMQQKILTHIHSQDLWQQFPVVAGMFYFHDTFMELGMQGIKQLYQMGPKGFIQRIFE